jgi:hypothetical protein
MKKVIPSRTPRRLTQAELASHALVTQARKDARVPLIQDVDTLLEGQAEKIKELADKHKVKSQYIRKLVIPATAYKKKCAPTLPNVIMHVKFMKIDDGKTYDTSIERIMTYHISDARFTRGRKDGAGRT